MTRIRLLRISTTISLLFCASCSEDDGFGGTTLRAESVSVAAGEVARVCLELSTGDEEVAATQNDLRWDTGCLSLVDDCVVDPAIDKMLLSNQRGPNELRAIIISLTDTDPIPAGRLYCCDLRATASSGCCTVEIFGGSASDLDGHLVNLHTSNGEVCIE
jgi:hypothetical protein